MLKNLLGTLVLLFIILGFFSKDTYACESCTIPQLGRDSTTVEDKNKKWFFKYLFEEQKWKEIPASEAHELHEDGHDIHVKTNEYFHHFIVGGNLVDRITVYTDIPYVIRNSIEIEDSARLGANEQLKGFGDLNLIGNYHLIKRENQTFSLSGGVKFPTGATGERNSVREKFESELQPGSGSYDYIVGGVYNANNERFNFLGNLAYVAKNEGAQDYQFGNVLSTSFFVDYLVNPNSESFKTELGINGNFQYEERHKHHGARVSDSGGTMFLLGPLVSIGTTPNTSLFSSILFPVYKNPNGVHQELDYTWTVGGKINW